VEAEPPTSGEAKAGLLCEAGAYTIYFVFIIYAFTFYVKVLPQRL
jgi:hypothetical protein